MFRSQTRLDHAFALATALLALSFVPSAADTGRSTSEANPESSWATSTCQANVPTGSTLNATQPATDQADEDDDFFSWIKKMVEPTTSGGQQNTSATTRPRNNRDSDGGRGGGGHGGGGGGGNGGH